MLASGIETTKPETSAQGRGDSLLPALSLTQKSARSRQITPRRSYAIPNDSSSSALGENQRGTDRAMETVVLMTVHNSTAWEQASCAAINRGPV